MEQDAAQVVYMGAFMKIVELRLAIVAQLRQWEKGGE